MGNSLDKPRSILDAIFGPIEVPKQEPTWSYMVKKVTSMSNIGEHADTEGYTATVTIPEGFNLNEIKASVDGNVVTITVPRVKAQSTVKELPVTKNES